MAIVRGGILSGTHGRLGQNLVVKERQGTQYIATLPVDFHKSMLPHEIEKRDRFRAYSKFSGGVNKNNYLFRVWSKTSFAPKMIYNRITQFNSKLTYPDRPSKDNVITPPGGFAFHINKLEYYPEKVVAEIQPVILNENEERIIYLLYTCLYEPINPGFKYFDFIRIREGKFQNINYTFYFTQEETNLALNYNHRILYLCAITLDSNREIIRFSETNSADLGELFEDK